MTKELHPWSPAGYLGNQVIWLICDNQLTIKATPTSANSYLTLPYGPQGAFLALFQSLCRWWNSPDIENYIIASRFN
jgi:hypothetical protein